MDAKKACISLFFSFLFVFIMVSYAHYHVPKKSIFLTPTVYIYGEINDTVLVRAYWIGTDSKEYNLIKDSNLSIVGLDDFAVLKKFGIKETLRYHDPVIKELTFGIYLTLNKTGIHESNVTLIIENKKENYRKELNIGRWTFEISPKHRHLLKVTDMIDLEIGFFSENTSSECTFAVRNIGNKTLVVRNITYTLPRVSIEKITYVNTSNLSEVNENTTEVPFPKEGLHLKPEESKVIIVHFKRGDYRYPRKPFVVRFKILYEASNRSFSVPLVFTYELVPIPTIDQIKSPNDLHLISCFQ
ncbi:MAG: hypothetical protein J7K57_03625 [Palaeococcus sp.]|uniref:hypothetical protein n=1 Tax=Palaeococcus sp. (in: euryarchaeotes) TaxID=2820298 RepID=UPI0025EF9AFF|nr:hypothetical protein [Palaeococcus sp. (in: euryarchaeotes)]MCD6558948.1 hypothetical protein [Palaeococcus sp. (in: euryarchaeotes)]